MFSIQKIKNSIKQRLQVFIAYIYSFIEIAKKDGVYYAFSSCVFVLASTSSNITDTVMEWMPLIITFAMLGMVLGMLKKFGKF